MKRLQIPQKRAYEKFYLHEKIYAKKRKHVQKAKKTCKPNNSDLNHN